MAETAKKEMIRVDWMINRKKQGIAVLLCILLVAGLSACGKGSKWIFSLNGEKLYYKDVMAFGLIYTKEYNIVNAQQLENGYDNDDTYGTFYKKELEDEIISSVLLYKEAQGAQYELSKEKKQEAEEKSKELVDFYGEEWLSERKVTALDIENVYEMKFLGESYAAYLSQDGENEKGDGEERYIRVYQVTFPTVELDEDGMVLSDEDGFARKLSNVQIEQRKADALEFVEKARGGEDMIKLLNSYDQSVTGMEKYLKYNDLEKEYKSAVDAVSENEVSDVIESSYGYYVIKLIESDAKEYADSVASYEKDAQGLEKKDDLVENLYETYIGDDKEYKNKERWKEIEFTSFLK